MQLCHVSDHIFEKNSENQLLCVNCNIGYLNYLKALDQVAEYFRQCKRNLI
jgi:hypothetical protein